MNLYEATQKKELKSIQIPCTYHARIIGEAIKDDPVIIEEIMNQIQDPDKETPETIALASPGYTSKVKPYLFFKGKEALLVF